MRNKLTITWITVILTLFSFLAYAGRLMNQDFATPSQITNAGGNINQLLNDTNIYITGSGVSLSAAIATGQLVSATGQLDANFAVKNVVDLTKQMRVSLGAGSTMTGVTLSFAQTTDSFYSFPDGTTTVVGHDRAQTLTNKTMDYNANTFLNFPSSVNQLSNDVTTGGVVPGYVTNASTTVMAVGTIPAYSIKDQHNFVNLASSNYSTSKLVSTNASGFIETNLTGSSNADGVGVYRLKDAVSAVDSASSFFSTSKLISTNGLGFVETNLTGSSNADGVGVYRLKDAVNAADQASSFYSTNKLISTNAVGIIETELSGSSQVDNVGAYRVADAVRMAESANADGGTSNVISRNAQGDFRTRKVTVTASVDLQDPAPGAFKVVMSAPVLAGDTNFKLPADNGAANQVLRTDGAGNTSWVAQSGGGSGSINELSGDVSTGGAVPSYVTNAATTVFSVGSVPAYKIKNQSDFIDQGSAYFSTSKLVSTNAAGIIETNISASSTIDGTAAYRVKDPIAAVDAASSELSVNKLVSTNAQGEIKTRIVSSFVEGISTGSIVSATSLISTATAQASSSTIVSRNAFGDFSAGTITANLTGSSTTVTGIIGVANGGTGASTTQGAWGSLMPAMVAKGDIIVRTGLGFDRLPVGPAGYVLTSAPVTSTAGIEWQASSGSGGAAQSSEYIATGGNGTGSTATKIRRYTTTRLNTGTDISCVDSATAGLECTVATDGVYDVAISDCHTTSEDNFGITVNDTETTSIFTAMNFANGEIMQACATGNANYQGSCSASMILSAGDVVRTHKELAASNCTQNHQVFFHMTKVGN